MVLKRRTKPIYLLDSAEQSYSMNPKNRLISAIWHHVFLQTKSELRLFFCCCCALCYAALCLVQCYEIVENTIKTYPYPYLSLRRLSIFDLFTGKCYCISNSFRFRFNCCKTKHQTIKLSNHSVPNLFWNTKQQSGAFFVVVICKFLTKSIKK